MCAVIMLTGHEISQSQGNVFLRVKMSENHDPNLAKDRENISDV